MNDTVKMPKRFDYSSGSDFNTAIKNAVGTNKVVYIDCFNMDYIDSAGIGLLVMANKQAQAGGAKLVMKDLKQGPREILQLANLQKIIEIR